MKHIYKYWRIANCDVSFFGPQVYTDCDKKDSDGYCEAEVTFQAEGSDDFDTQWFSKEFKTLQAAINATQKHMDKHSELDLYYSMYAYANIKRCTNRGRVLNKEEDCVKIGFFSPDGEYETFQGADWLEKA